MYLLQSVTTAGRARNSGGDSSHRTMERRTHSEDFAPLSPEQRYSPTNYNINSCGVPTVATPNYYVPSPTKKFDPSKIPSRIYTEYAKPVYVNNSTQAVVETQNHYGHIQKSPDKSPQIVPSNIQSYLENNEPIYQNEKPQKFYELMTPQKFIKSQRSPSNSTENFKNPYTQQVIKSPDIAVAAPTSPDVVKEEKKKKWSLGGLFRRRKKDSETDSSSQEDDSKMGFLARRRSRREKLKKRANKSTTGFDHIIVKPQEKGDVSKERGGQLSSPAEQTMSADSLTKSPGTTNMLRVKAPSRDSLGGSHDRLSSRSSRYQDSSLSRNSSGGSGSLEGLSRRERRLIIKQRAEALRVHDSSSEEDPNNLNAVQRSGSLSRRSRFARTERYIKRLSREEESVLQREAMEKQRVSKSDAESGFTGSRWTPMYVDSSDGDPRYLVTSATPSPGQSPLVRHKNILQYANSAPMASTSSPGSLERRNHQHLNMRGSKSNSIRGNSPLPGSYEQKPPHRQANNDNFQYPGQRSLSYDNNIHRVPHLNNPPSPDDNVLVVQFPVARISRLDPAARGFVAVKPGPPAPPPRDPLRRYTPNCIGPDSARPMSYAFENGSQQGLAVRRGQDGSFQSLNQPAAGQFVTREQQAVGQQGNVQRQYIRQRPASVTPDEMRPLPGGRHFVDPGQKAHIQYYADQTPRSRKPIHIQYNQEQPYLSDSQVVLMKPPQAKNPISQVTEFWRQKEQETNANNVKARKNSVPRSRSPSPHLKDSQESLRVKNRRGSVPPRLGDSLSSLSGHSDLSSPVKQSDVHDSYESLGTPNSDSLRRKEQRLSMVLESHEQAALLLGDGRRLQELTPKMRYLQDCLPATKLAQDNSTKVKPVESVSNARVAVDNVPKMRVSQEVRSSQLHVPKTKPAIDNKSKMPSPEVKSNANPLDSKYPKTKSSPQITSPPKEISAKTRFMFHEPPVTAKDFEALESCAKSNPPVPPVRRISRHLSFEPTDGAEEAEARKRTSSNLEDALDELEAIYKSLKLGDEDLLDRAERRDLPTKFQLREPLPEPVHLDRQGKGSMSDSGYDLSPCVVRKRAPPTRRSVIPDRVTDDMAYRRLHPKDRPNSQNIVSQAGSFLLTSPVLSQASSFSYGLDQDPLKLYPNDEPDITFDDVVYRNIRHVNNALKVVEPQPPFGIPLGPVAPSPNSDYLHSKPSDRYRPTFKPRRTPDVVSDDLAYRNLRKDNPKDASLLTAVENALHNARLKDCNFSLRKRRAIRSLSANLPSLIGHDKLSIMDVNLLETNNNFEKAQSLTHLPDAIEIAQKMLEGKEVIGGGSAHLWANGIVPSEQNGRNERVVDRNSICTGMSTSTETLTDSRANLTMFQDSLNKRNSWQHKLRVNIPLPQGSASDGKNLDENVLPPEEYSGHVDTNCPIYEHVNGALPVPDSVPGSPLDEGQLEDMLCALARDARTTSEQLEIQLAGFKKAPALESVNLVRKTEDISDDSLEVNAKEPSQREMDEAKAVLESLDIYETDGAVDEEPDVKVVDVESESNNNSPIKTCNQSESDFVPDDYDEEVEEIFHWENNRNFDNAVRVNNNNVPAESDAKKGSTGPERGSESPEHLPVPKPRSCVNIDAQPEAVEPGKGEQRRTSVTAMAAGKNGTSSEGEGRSGGKWFGQEPTNVLMACTYCIACTQQMIGLDFLTVFGVILAIIMIVAFLML